MRDEPWRLKGWNEIITPGLNYTSRIKTENKDTYLITYVLFPVIGCTELTSYVLSKPYHTFNKSCNHFWPSDTWSYNTYHSKYACRYINGPVNRESSPLACPPPFISPLRYHIYLWVGNSTSSTLVAPQATVRISIKQSRCSNELTECSLVLYGERGHRRHNAGLHFIPYDIHTLHSALYCNGCSICLVRGYVSFQSIFFKTISLSPGQVNVYI